MTDKTVGQQLVVCLSDKYDTVKSQVEVYPGRFMLFIPDPGPLHSDGSNWCMDQNTILECMTKPEVALPGIEARSLRVRVLPMCHRCARQKVCLSV